MTHHSPPTVLSELCTQLLLLASSKLICEPLILDVKFCIYALVARGSLCYSFAIVCLFFVCICARSAYVGELDEVLKLVLLYNSRFRIVDFRNLLHPS